MESVSLKMEKTFLREIDKVMKKHNYITKTEFIREAIRDKIKKLEEHEKENFTQHANAGESRKKEVKQIPSYI
jgi:metal-responsive CopG/Arc/MetJ family transcriptional regulator